MTGRGDHAQWYAQQMNFYQAQREAHPVQLSVAVGQIYNLANLAGLPEEKQVGEIVGWREWVFREGGYLRSLYFPAFWYPGERMVADRDPFESDGGFYAHKTVEQLSPIEEPSGPSKVGGTVLLWGHVVEHEHGYRAQYARVGKLLRFEPGTNESFIRWLKAEYDTPE